MEMQQIRYFVALMRELNFTRAAELCNVSQPALTRAIQALEAELGGPLFHRERQQTHLSELGRMMAPHFESILEQSETLKDRARNFGKPESQELKVGAMCTIGPNVLSDFIVRFYSQFDGIGLTIADDAGTMLPERLLNGDLEVALFGLPEALDERLHALPLFVERYVCVLPEKHPLARQDKVRAKDLNGVPYVCRINCEMEGFADRAFAELGVDGTMVFRSERDEWVLGMIKAGLGWGFFPEYSSFPAGVAVRPLMEPMFQRTISLVTVRGRPHSPAVGAFVRGARTHRWPQLTPEPSKAEA
ncbi:MAG TPA: LysR family transcriptional regulator [Hyphomonadaceae bacterium]|nr:LysR family transcriptional regulator [Hyphomonadaceae bacterium]